ncbi:MAG: hypothetical protein B6D65_01365 [candidate division Zixibacteria bacterium 4484_93]|nr:MAG: hypothetical protein B6D65_01365 [candidate division Zixibacteria bacterium 4484_93]
MNEKTKLIQVGVGAWGRNLLRNFSSLPDVEVIGLCDESEETQEKLRKQFPDLAVAADYRKLLDNLEVDAVVIATPPAYHYEIAKESLALGKDVFVEKPMTLAISEAEELVQLAEENKRILMVGHIMEYHPIVVRMRKYIESGELGDIYYVYSTRVNLGKLRDVENALWSFAPHDISMITYLLREKPTRVSATGAAYLREDIEDVSFITLFFDSGTIAHIHTSWLDPHKIRRLTIVGSKKMAVLDDVEPQEKIRIYDKGVNIQQGYDTYGEYLSLRTGDIVIPAVKVQEPLRIECQEFVKAIKSRVPPITDGKDGLAVLRVLRAADSSMKENGTPHKC